MKQNLKTALIVAFCSLLSSSLFAQDSIVKKVVAEDGSMFQYRMMLNEPDNYSNFGISAGLLAAYGSKNIIPGFSIETHGQINQKLFVRANFRFGFPISIADTYWDDNFDGNKDLRSARKIYQNHDLIFAYKLFGNTVERNAMIILDEESDVMVDRVYYRVEKVKFNRGLHLTLGVDYLQRRLPANLDTLTPIKDPNDNPSADFEYRAVNILTSNLRVGLDWRLSTFNIKEVDGWEKPDYQDMSLYAQALLPMYTHVGVVKLTDNMTGLEPTPEVEEVENGFEPLELNNFGFLVGIRIMNSHTFKRRVVFALETGMLPGPSQGPNGKNFIIQMGITMGLGTDLKKQLDKQKK